MSLNGVVKRAIISLARSIPDRLWWRIFRLWLHVIAAQPVRTALTTLLEIESALDRPLNRTAIQYDEGLHVKHRLMRYHDFFVDKLRAGERVLDIGCGYGAVAYSMASRAGAMVTGIDLEAHSIQQARSLFQHPNLSFVQGDALQDLPAGPFDTIVMSNVLEHIEHRTDFLQQVQARTEPERWLIRVPMFNRDWRVPLRRELGLFYFSDPGHYIEYTRKTFAEEMNAAGLTITQLQINWGEIWAEVRADHLPARSEPQQQSEYARKF